MKRITLFLLGLLLLAHASARIGQPAEPTIGAMTEAGLIGTEGFDIQPVVYGDLLFSLAGETTGEKANFALLGEAIGFATGYFDQIAGPVQNFLQTNLADLLAAGTVVVPVEGSYLLELDLSEAESGAILVSWSFGLRELDTSLFLDSRHSLGADVDSARIVIREFADLQCPHCRTFATEVVPQLEQLLADSEDIRLEFHHLPLVTIHANALPAAEASECVAAANEGEGFWEFTTLVFQRMQAWQQLPETGPYFVSLAQEAGLATDGVADCIANRDQLEYVNSRTDHAVRDLGLTGTPSVFVNGFQVTGWNQLESYLELIALIEARSAAP